MIIYTLSNYFNRVAVATFLEKLAGGLPTVSGVQKALRCQKAEHTFADTPCGIMDQYISSMGRAGNLLLIDCRSQEYQLVPFGTGPGSPVIIVTNSQVKHQLSGSEYPDRVNACKEAVAAVKKRYPSVKALRDITVEMLEESKADMSATTFRRAMHGVSEDRRTLDTMEALKAGDFERVGMNMTASHESLRDDYEVSCEELDILVNLANSVPGVYGSRMTGGGFGGCTVTLVRKDAVDALTRKLKFGYRETGRECIVYPPMVPSAGAAPFSLQEVIAEYEKKKRNSALPALVASWAIPVTVILLAVSVGFVLLKRK